VGLAVDRAADAADRLMVDADPALDEATGAIGVEIGCLRGMGTFSLTVPGPVDSADTLDSQGGPRGRNKPLQEKEFRATYCLSVHC
jgi:hypothetical protein